LTSPGTTARPKNWIPTFAILQPPIADKTEHIAMHKGSALHKLA
jgi:hypothetical protein